MFWIWKVPHQLVYWIICLQVWTVGKKETDNEASDLEGSPGFILFWDLQRSIWCEGQSQTSAYRLQWL